MLIAAVAGIMVAGTIVAILPSKAYAFDIIAGNGGVGGAGGAGGVGGNGGSNTNTQSGTLSHNDNDQDANGGDANGGRGGSANGGNFCAYAHCRS